MRGSVTMGLIGDYDAAVPEFRLPSSDGLDAWLVRVFPALDRELALRSRPATKPGTDPG